MEFQFREGARLLTFRDKRNKRTLISGINKSIYHNFRQSTPENVNPSFTKYNFYLINGEDKRINKNEGYKKAKDYQQSLMNLVKESWNEQQKAYSPSKRTSFDSFCNKHVIYMEGVLPNARQEWFEAMDICKFTDDYVDDAKTGTRKMGKLIINSINWKRLNLWAKAEINFIKQWMTKNLGSDKGFVYASIHLDETTPHIHIGMLPITKVFSKTLNQERYVLSNNKNFGGSLEMQKFHTYHANYLTKSGFQILPGERGGKGSYNGATFQEVKAIEKNRLEQEINELMHNLSLMGGDYQNYKNAKHYLEYYNQKINDVKTYLSLEEFNDYEKNQLHRYLEALKKVRYYKIINSAFIVDQEQVILLEQYQNSLDEMTIKLDNILSRGYSLIL